MSPITAIMANAWSAAKTKFSFSPSAVILTAPAIIANKGRQDGAAREPPTDPTPSSKLTMRVTRLVLISAKVSQSKQSRPRSEECQQRPTPTLDKPSDNSSPLFPSAPDQPAAQNSHSGHHFRHAHLAVIEKLCCPFPCGPSKEILAFQSPAMSILILAR